MVVTRKGTSTPIPPNSRTNSSTNSPKIKPKKAVESSSLKASSSLQPLPPPVVGTASLSRFSDKQEPRGPEFDDPIRIISPKKSPAKKDKSKSKAKGRKSSPTPPEPSTFQSIRGVVRLSVLAFLTSYALVVCPYDTREESSICSTLYDFRRELNHHILYPHVYPQLDKLLAHPKVAPVVRYSQPVVQQVIAVAIPARARLNSLYLSQCSPVIRSLRVKASPLIDAVDSTYQRTLEPYVTQAQIYGKVAGRLAEPYVRATAAMLRLVWVQAKPYLYILWKYSLRVPEYAQIHVFNPFFSAAEVYVWRPAVGGYYTYVDPHLNKILQTVEEIGREPKSSPAASRFGSSFMARAAEVPPLPKKHVNPEEVSKLFDSVDVDSVDDDELAQFLRDLDTPTEPEEAAKPKVETTPEDEEEKKRRDAMETAEKRAEIQGRHTQWEEKLDNLINEHITVELPEALKVFRDKAAAELKTMDFGGPVKAEAEKTLTNIEAFVKKLMSEKTGGAEKVALLEDLMGKVHRKMEATTETLSKSITTWWEKARKDEGDLIEEFAKKVSTLAGEAQSNLGLDYSWLDDVTVADWRRYHALAKKAESHKQTLIEIANGSDSRSPSNGLVDALRELQSELQNTVLGFFGKIQDAHKEGLAKFGGKPVKDGEDPEEPTASILPVPEEDPEDGEGIEITDPNVDPEVQHAFVGKSKEQVEEAMKQAEGHDEL